MLIAGEWHPCDDGVLRPILRGEVQAGDGSWLAARFLVDTGADHTVFSPEVWQGLLLESVDSPYRVEGVGGRAGSVVVQTAVRLTRDQDRKITIRGEFLALVEVGSLDMSVVGRDILNQFALIVDRPQNVVCLLGQNHFYTIGER
jgi:predicted aspartyl protease